MRIIAVVSQKGGAGKTTLAGHLGVAAEQQDMGPVALMDTDPQGSLSAWWNSREAPTPLFAQSDLASLDANLDALRRHGIRLLIIDTPPALTRSIEGVIQRADLVVIPTRPGPHDLRATGATVDLVEHVGKPLVFVVNGGTMRARLTADAAIALSQHGTVAPSIIHNRQDFATSMIDGRTVIEVSPNGKSAGEIDGVMTYIGQRLKKLPMGAGFKPATNGSRMPFGKRRQVGGQAAADPAFAPSLSGQVSSRDEFGNRRPTAATAEV